MVGRSQKELNRLIELIRDTNFNLMPTLPLKNTCATTLVTAMATVLKRTYDIEDLLKGER